MDTKSSFTQWAHQKLPLLDRLEADIYIKNVTGGFRGRLE